MSYLTAREALTYAISREMVQVYVVVLAGILLQLLGATLFLEPLPYLVSDLLRRILTIVGFVATFVGSVAVLFKLVADGTAQA